MTRKIKKIVFTCISLVVLIFLVSSFLKSAHTNTYSVDQLLSEVSTGVISEKPIIITGKIDASSLEVNVAKSELKFNLVSENTNNKIPVLYRGDSKPGLTNNETVYIKGLYTVERIFIGEKLIKN